MKDPHTAENHDLDAKILIVDDDELFVSIARHMLSDYRHQYFASSGIEALKLARDIIPDIMLVDYDMPDLSGADLCAVFKSDPRLRAIPVIFITSHRKVAVVAATFNVGCDDFLTKPISRSLLLERVVEQFRRTRHTQDPVAV